MNHLKLNLGYCPLKILSGVFSIICLLVSHENWAQEHQFMAVVRDKAGNVLENVEVFDADGNMAYSDPQGHVVLQVESNPVSLVFYKENYLILEQIFKVQQEEVEVTLEDIIALNEVVVQKNRDRVFALKHLRDVEGMSIYAGKKTETIAVDKLVANKAVNTARQVFAQVAGITFNENADAGLQLNIGA